MILYLIFRYCKNLHHIVLAHTGSMFCYWAPWKHATIFIFLTISGETQVEYWSNMEYKHIVKHPWWWNIRFFIHSFIHSFIRSFIHSDKVWLLQVCFACRFTVACCWKRIQSRTQEKLQLDCLEHHCERSLRLCDWSSTQASLFLLTGQTGRVNLQGCGVHWYLSWLGS